MSLSCESCNDTSIEELVSTQAPPLCNIHLSCLKFEKKIERERGGRGEKQQEKLEN